MEFHHLDAKSYLSHTLIDMPQTNDIVDISATICE